MKKLFVRTISLVMTLTLAVGVILSLSAFSRRLPKETFVNGVNVGGLDETRAIQALRGAQIEYLKTKRLHICANERVFTYEYPEFNFLDDFKSSVKSIKKKGNYFSPVYIYLNGAAEICTALCAEYDREPIEPQANFNSFGEPFTYSDGADGVKCDKDKLVKDIAASLNGGFERVTVKQTVIPRTQSPEAIRENTVRLASFTTYFDGSNQDRSSNIRLAASKLNGQIIKPAETLSFNATVGRRTAENGFKKAKIIVDGKFTDGVGGGVCQVSTTLYNAALLSGLEISEFHPHSLAVSYVPPSRDAMVSGSDCDLKITNKSGYPVYIRASTAYNSVTFSIFGRSDGYKYSCVTSVTGVITRPCKIVEGEVDGEIISAGRDGTLSEGYLIREKDGVKESIKIRTDKYKPLAQVKSVKRERAQESVLFKRGLLLPQSVRAQYIPQTAVFTY